MKKRQGKPEISPDNHLFDNAFTVFNEYSHMDEDVPAVKLANSLLDGIQPLPYQQERMEKVALVSLMLAGAVTESQIHATLDHLHSPWTTNTYIRAAKAHWHLRPSGWAGLQERMQKRLEALK